MARFLGARELGITIEWRVRFVPVGSTVRPLPGVVYVDVGGSVEPGIIDHHQGTMAAESASEIVLRQVECSYGHLMGPLLRQMEEGRLSPGGVWKPTLITHSGPDWDAVVATYLIRRIVEEGDFPSCAEGLVAYSAGIDQGRYRIDRTVDRFLYAPHLGYLALQHLLIRA